MEEVHPSLTYRVPVHSSNYLIQLGYHWGVEWDLP
jgi:hypothetical protein